MLQNVCFIVGKDSTVVNVRMWKTMYNNLHWSFVCVCSGGLDLKSQEVALRLGPDVLIATPGRLIDHLHNTPSFELSQIEVLILDEADR